MVVISEIELSLLIERATQRAVQRAFQKRDEPPFLDSKQVARLFSVSVRSVVGWRARRAIPFHKINGRVLFRRSEIEEFIAHRRVKRRSVSKKEM
jgi:predicted DNA-binding transcriptional regulator AlpA